MGVDPPVLGEDGMLVTQVNPLMGVVDKLSGDDIEEGHGVSGKSVDVESSDEDPVSVIPSLVDEHEATSVSLE